MENKTNFIIRNLRANDLTAFIDYETELDKERFSDPNFGQSIEKTALTPKELKKWFLQLYKSTSDRNSIVYVAMADGIMVGICSVIRKDKWQETAHVGELGIDLLKNYRGIGIGKALMTKTIDKSKKMFEIIKAYDIFSTNKPALNLYQSFGFKKCAVFPRHIKRKNRYIDTISMYLRL